MVDHNIVKKYLGIPYKHNGRDLKGLDCLGLMQSFLADHGVNIPSSDGCTINTQWYKADPERFVRGLSKYGSEVPYVGREALDVTVFEIKGMPVHAGVIVDYLRFIHIMEGRYVQLGRFTRWKNRVYKVFRIDGGEG